MTAHPPPTGHVDPGLEPVTAVFAELIATGAEPGGSVSVFRDGREVVSLSGGWLDAGRTRPFGADGLVQVYSAGKPIAAVAALLAVADGLLTLDDPVATWWPAYAAHGKGTTTLRHILSHTAGVPAFSARVLEEEVDALDRDALIRDLVEAVPVGEPGTVIAEHALTYGHLIEGVLAAAGAPDARTAASGHAAALGAEFWFGVPEEALDRVGDLELLDASWVDSYLARDLGRRALTIPDGRLDPARANTVRWRRASFPADGLITTARSLARFYDDAVRPQGVLATRLGDGLRREFLRTQASGHDLFLGGGAAWGLGLRTDDDEPGMGGIGGSCGWYSHRHGYAMAYVSRGLGRPAATGADRADLLADALEAALRDLPS